MPKEVKTERLQRLIERQKYWSMKRNERWLKRELRVLIKDDPQDASQADGDYIAGHSDQNHTVLVPKEQVKAKGLYPVMIESVTPHTLYGTVKGYQSASIPLMMV
ncbi:MAG: hypothetical protein R2865_15800 [Deinococcales bacterium]